jgi:curli biogenesis system outer membrane secretion channel CsgG
VRAGIPVDVRVVDSEDREVYSTTRPVAAPIAAGSA